MLSINYWAILVSAIASIIVGSIWYNPAVFGKLWMRLSGLTNETMKAAKEKGMGKSYFIAFIGSLVMAYVLAHFVDYLGATTISAGFQAAFWIWLGFSATKGLGSTLWEGKPWKLYFLNAAYDLVNLLIMGAILAVWA